MGLNGSLFYCCKRSLIASKCRWRFSWWWWFSCRQSGALQIAQRMLLAKNESRSAARTASAYTQVYLQQFPNSLLQNREADALYLPFGCLLHLLSTCTGSLTDEPLTGKSESVSMRASHTGKASATVFQQPSLHCGTSFNCQKAVGSLFTLCWSEQRSFGFQQ